MVLHSVNKQFKEVSVLFAVLLLGFILRSFQLNFPSIGYHNMQENEYLSMAKEMQRTQDFTTKRVYFYNGFLSEPIVKSNPQPPIVAYQSLFAWKRFGENLWGPRLFNILFGEASILVIYFVSLLLFNNRLLSLFSAFLLAIMPLGVFFSRNIQPESPAFFFMLLGSLFYLKFASSFKKYNLLLGGLWFSFAWAYKFSFLFGVVPFLFCFPFKALLKDKKEFIKFFLALALPYCAIVMVVLKLKQLGQWQGPQVNIPGLFEIFSLPYWSKYGNSIWWYVRAENFTYVFIILAFLGIMLAFLKGSGLLNRYLIGWASTAVFYGMASSESIRQQNYSQMLLLGAVCISCSYALLFLSQTAKKFFKKDLILFFILAVIATSAPFVYGSISRMYSTVFLGEDVAGGSLRELTAAHERVFLLTHAQGYAISRYAQRYTGWVSDLKEFKEKEDKFKIRYLCVYPAQYFDLIAKDYPELFTYIQSNYHIKEAGVFENPNQLVYLIFEKGSGQNLRESQSISGHLQLKTIYRIFSRLIFFYTVSPAVEKK